MVLLNWDERGNAFGYGLQRLRKHRIFLSKRQIWGLNIWLWCQRSFLTTSTAFSVSFSSGKIGALFRRIGYCFFPQPFPSSKHLWEWRMLWLHCTTKEASSQNRRTKGSGGDAIARNSTHTQTTLESKGAPKIRTLNHALNSVSKAGKSWK